MRLSYWICSQKPTVWSVTYVATRHFKGGEAPQILCLYQARLTGVIMFSTCLSVRPSVTKLMNTMFWKGMNRFDASFHNNWSTRQGNEAFSFGDHEVKGQGHTRPTLGLEKWLKMHGMKLQDEVAEIWMQLTDILGISNSALPDQKAIALLWPVFLSYLLPVIVCYNGPVMSSDCCWSEERSWRGRLSLCSIYAQMQWC